MEEKVVKGVTVNISGDASELKEELQEVRRLAKKAGAAVSSATSKAKHMSATMDREMPDNNAVLMSLRRFVVRVAEDERATPDQLMAMTKAANVVLEFS